MSRLFGTDGVRGVANVELTVDLAMKLGKAGAYVLTKENKHKPTLLVGCDTRISGDMLANALMAGICSVGANVVFAGVLPTPAVAYLTRSGKFDAGVVISASHNPMEFNGIKFFNGEGYKLSDSLEDEIQQYIERDMAGIPVVSGPDVGKTVYDFELEREYIDFVKNTVPVNLKGLKIVLDCAEGASYRTSVKAITELGADVIPTHVDPTGININDGCGSTHLEDLSRNVVKHGADVGLAFDGDADRLLAVDETGKVIDGDKLMAICGIHLKSLGRLKKNTIVATVMSNMGFFIMGKEQGITIEQTKVGDRYVLERMREIDASIGGEQSGHIIFLDENTTGDGLLSALHFLETMVSSGKKASELAAVMNVLPQALVNAKVSNDMKNKYTEYPVIVEAIEELEKRFDGEGRVLIRPSGTEPLVRVMIEGKDQKEIDAEAKKLARLIVDTLNEKTS
ncbi:MAG: phosphoglucosamine mutase [Lachnospiraceae bacterium]|nr:phosphoglucosamine mutase [Lachnospiraceae bacterium]